MSTISMSRGVLAAEPASRTALWVGVPWFVWASAASVSCAVFGLHFDVAWHRSIGRDSFWNPAHMVMYASGVIAAVFCGYLIAATTFGQDAELKRHSVRIWGLQAPIGVFVACWGGLGVLYDAVFDNWWHNAYGLDVRFTSPPHLLFSISLWSVMLGSLLLAFSYLNRSGAGLNGGLLRAIVLYMGALLATAQMFACFSYTWDTKLHQAKAYVAVAIFLPVALAVMSWATRYRWTCTVMAAIYSAIHIGLILLLPLFAATPRLGPIYVPVTHFIPPRFPLLILLPAVVLDLIWQRRGWARGIVPALGAGVVFTALLVAVEWPFANFLLSSASGNRFFGTRYLGFDDLTAPPDATLWRFTAPEHGLALMIGLAVAAICAAVGIYVGAMVGERLRLIRR